MTGVDDGRSGKVRNAVRTSGWAPGRVHAADVQLPALQMVERKGRQAGLPNVETFAPEGTTRVCRARWQTQSAPWTGSMEIRNPNRS